MSEWGNPPRLIPRDLSLNEIGDRGEPGELKHLSNLRKRDYSVSSGERTRRSPNRCALVQRGCRTRQKLLDTSETVLERQTVEGDSPVRESERQWLGILSTTEHANFVGNWGVHFPRLNTLDDR